MLLEDFLGKFDLKVCNYAIFSKLGFFQTLNAISKDWFVLLTSNFQESFIILRTRE